MSTIFLDYVNYTLSAILTVPLSTSRLKISSPKYVHTIVVALALVSIAGGFAVKIEKMMQPRTMIAPSRQTAAYDFKKLFPIWLVGSPANVDKGIGVIAV